MVTLQDVYDAFLARISDDEWSDCNVTEEDLEWMIKDWRAILQQAIPYFKFPRCSLLIDDITQTFVDPKMSDDEVAILAVYMKQQWVKRSIDTWDNIKTQYEKHEFSQAHLLNQFIKLKAQANEEAKELEAIYYRAPGKSPFKFGRLAGRGGGPKRKRR